MQYLQPGPREALIVRNLYVWSGYVGICNTTDLFKDTWRWSSDVINLGLQPAVDAVCLSSTQQLYEVQTLH